MSIDPDYFDWIAEAVTSEWPAGVMDIAGRRYIFGEVENVLFEVDPQDHGVGRVVLTRTDFARNVPDTDTLHTTLSSLNRSIPAVTFGLREEPRGPGFLAVRAFTTVVGADTGNRSLIHGAIRACLSAAVRCLEAGFTDRLGGELGSDVTKRELGVS